MRRRTFLNAGGAALGVGAVTLASLPLLRSYFSEGKPGHLLGSTAELPRPYQVPQIGRSVV